MRVVSEAVYWNLRGEIWEKSENRIAWHVRQFFAAEVMKDINLAQNLLYIPVRLKIRGEVKNRK
jgi:hypothetical protein